jgi:hypothetical protein
MGGLRCANSPAAVLAALQDGGPFGGELPKIIFNCQRRRFSAEEGAEEG